MQNVFPHATRYWLFWCLEEGVGMMYKTHSTSHWPFFLCCSSEASQHVLWVWTFERVRKLYVWKILLREHWSVQILCLHWGVCIYAGFFAWQADQDCCHPTSRFGWPFISVFESRHFERIICCDWCYVVVSTFCVHHIPEILNEFRQAELKSGNYDAKIHVKQMSTGLSPCLMPKK